MKIFEIFFWPLLGVGNEWIGPKNNILKNIFSEKMLKKWDFFFLTIYQLKNTSDCIKIDPPGPGRNLKKNFLIFFFEEKPEPKLEKFVLFSKFCPGPGGFGYNRLSFWAGRRPLKKYVFAHFCKIFLRPIHSFPTLRSGQKHILFFFFS